MLKEVEPFRRLSRVEEKGKEGIRSYGSVQDTNHSGRSKDICNTLVIQKSHCRTLMDSLYKGQSHRVFVRV